MTATTALTAQNTQSVIDVFHTPPEFVRKQVDACIDDIGVDVVKTGMLEVTRGWRSYYTLLILPRNVGIRGYDRSCRGGSEISRIPVDGH